MKDFIIGIGIVALLVLLIWLIKRKSAQSQHYDEMQLKIRADGYRLGFFVTLFLIVAAILAVECGLDQYIASSLVMFTALMAGIVSFAVYCVMKEAFFSIGDKGGFYIVICLIIVLLDGGLSVSRIVDGSFWEGGAVSFPHGAGLVCALAFLVLLVALLIKKLQLRKEDAE